MKRLAVALLLCLSFNVWAQLDIKYAVTDCVLPTGTGNFECTIGSLGWTPKATAVTVTGATTDATGATDARISFGAVGEDGSGTGNQWATSINDDHGVSTTASKNVGIKDGVIALLNATGSAIEFRATGAGNGSGTCLSGGTVGPNADGWCFNSSVASGTAHRAVVEFWGGSDLNVNVGTFALSAGVNMATNIAIDTTTGDGQFQADLILTAGNNSSWDGTINNNGITSFGAAELIGTVVQRAVCVSLDNAETTVDNYHRVESDSGNCSLNVSGALNWSVEYSAHANGFTATERDGALSGDEIGYIAFEIPNGGDVWVGTVTAPSSAASNWTESGPNFLPVGARLIQSGITTTTGVDSTASDTQAATIGNSGYDGTREHTTLIQSEDAQTTTDTENWVNNRFLFGVSGSGPATHHDGDFTSGNNGLNGQGWTMLADDIDTADSALLWIGVAVGAGGSTAAIRRQHGED